jgi:alkanesulfonate monooxygenase SsuD/methylene tetrahydromethanopterin reductase-like flavin-dependent oxidoreductase (luciferase family)
VAIAGTRLAPVTAHSIASINQIAPGRTFLGIGTGHTAMRVMGQKPMGVAEFREYLRVVRVLLHGEAVEYTFRGRTREIKFLHRDRRFINLEDPIPIYVAANGPKVCEAAGEFGDGWVTAGGINARVGGRLARIRAGAERAGRTLGPDFHTAALTSSCVLRPGERLTSERVINQTGAQVASAIHFAYENWKSRGKSDDAIPPGKFTKATELSCNPRSAASSRPTRFAALAWSASPTNWSRNSRQWKPPASRRQ